MNECRSTREVCNTLAAVYTLQRYILERMQPTDVIS